MSSLEKIARRSKFPVELPNGETVYFRSPDFSDQMRGSALPDTQKIGFLIGRTMLEDDGSPTFTQADGELDSDFGDRVVRTPGLDGPTINAIGAALSKLNKPETQKVLEKNLPETSTAA